jgi:hypothetical protein
MWGDLEFHRNPHEVQGRDVCFACKRPPMGISFSQPSID